MNLGHRKDAVKSVMTAVDMRPKSVEFRLMAAQSLLSDLKPEKAQQQIDTALELDPELRSLQKMIRLQHRINRMKFRAEQNPLDWATRQFNRRISNVAKEEKKRS
jgi:predicted Zn-dependent protease